MNIIILVISLVLEMDFFKAFGNKNRAGMLKLLVNKEAHISGLARALNISVPVALRHVNILEEAGLVERRKIGNVHQISLCPEAMEKIKKAGALFDAPLSIAVPKGTRVLDALKKISGIKIEEKKEGAFITEVDGKKGYYIYEVNGKLPDKPIDKLLLEKDSVVELKLLLPVIGKKALIKVV